MQSSKTIDFVRAVYPYACTDQAKGLAFPESVVLLVVERSEDGWCRGFAAGNQGWFPASYVQSLPLEKLQELSIDPNHLATILQSALWTAYATQEKKIYFVNNNTKVTRVTSQGSGRLSVPHHRIISFSYQDIHHALPQCN